MVKLNFWEINSTSPEFWEDNTSKESKNWWNFNIKSLLNTVDPNNERQSVNAVKKILNSKTFSEMTENQKKQFDAQVNQYRYLEKDCTDWWLYMLLSSLEKLESKFVSEQSITTISSEWRWDLKSRLSAKTEKNWVKQEQWKNWRAILKSSLQMPTENDSIMKIWVLKWQVMWSYNAAINTANAINVETLQSKTVERFKKVWQDNWWKDVEITWSDLSWLWEAAKWSKSAIIHLINEIYKNTVNSDGSLNLDSELIIDWQKVDINASFSSIEEKLIYINNLLQEINKLGNILKDNYNWVLKYIDTALWIEETSRGLIKKWANLTWVDGLDNDAFALLIEWLLGAFGLYMLNKVFLGLPFWIAKILFWTIFFIPKKIISKNKIERRVEALRSKYGWISDIPESEINSDKELKETIEKLMKWKLSALNIEKAYMKKYSKLEFIEKQEINKLLRDSTKTKVDVETKIEEIFKRVRRAK